MTNERSNMKIVVIGGSGLIGSKLVTKLGEHGYQSVAASPNSGVNTLTGDGLGIKPGGSAPAPVLASYRAMDKLMVTRSSKARLSSSG